MKSSRLWAAAGAALALLLVFAISQAGLITQSGSRHHVEQGGGGSEFSHGETVPIPGSGYGTGPTTSFLQPQIEATGVAATISLPSDGWVDADSGFASNSFVGYSDPTRGPAIRSPSSSPGTPSNHAVVWDSGSNAATNSLYYFTWWTRAQTLGANYPTELDDDGGTADPGGGDAVNWQWKLARWRFNNDVLDQGASGDAYVAHWENSDGSFYNAETSGFHFINGSGSPFVNGVSGRRAGGDDLPTAYTQVWSRVEWIWSMGSSGTGRSRMYVTHAGGTRNLVGIATNVTFFSGGAAFRYLVLQNYWGNIDEEPGASFAGSFLALDDCYAQVGNLKRVELTNHATLGSETWREIQDPSSWTDTEIEVTLNTGADRSGTAWLKVIETNLTTGAETELGSLQITISALWEPFEFESLPAANDDALVLAA